MIQPTDSWAHPGFQRVDPDLIEKLASNIDYLYCYFETIAKDGNDFERLMLKSAFLANKSMPFTSHHRNFIDCIDEIANQFQSLLNPKLAPIHSFLIQRIEQQITFILKIIRRQHTFIEAKIKKPVRNNTDGNAHDLELPQYKPVSTHDISVLICEVGELGLTLEKLTAQIQEQLRVLDISKHNNKHQSIRRIEHTLDKLYKREKAVVKQLALSRSRLNACQLALKQQNR